LRRNQEDPRSSPKFQLLSPAFLRLLRPTPPTLFTIKMRSFGIFTAVAAVACSIFASAAPLDVAAAGAGVAAVHARSPLSLDVPVVEARAEVESLVVLLTDLKAKVEPVCGQLTAFTAVDIKVDVVVELLAEIVAAVKVTLVGCKALIGADVSVILAAVDGTAVVALSVVATLLADILCLVLAALVHILLFVKVEVLGAVFVEVGVVLGSLTGCCCSLLDGLLVLILPLIVSIVAGIKLCAFVSLAAVLNIAI